MWRQARRPRIAPCAQFQRRIGIDVRLLDARGGMGADEFPPDPDRGGVSRIVVRRRGAYLRCGVPRPRGGGNGGEPSVQAGGFHWRRFAGMGRAGDVRAADDAGCGRSARPSSLVLLYLWHHRKAEGRRVDARADGIRGLQSFVRSDARHDGTRRVAGSRAVIAWRRYPRAAPGGARRRHGASAGRAAGLRGSLAPGGTPPRHQHVHRADDPYDADAARCGGPLRSCVVALCDLCRRPDVSCRSGARAGQARQGSGAVFRHGRGDGQHHRSAARSAQPG